MTELNYEVQLTKQITSLAKSLAKSGVTKHANPDNDTPASYTFILHKSCRFKNMMLVKNTDAKKIVKNLSSGNSIVKVGCNQSFK